MDPKKIGLGLILVILVIYILSPLDLLPAIEVDDAIASIIAIATAFKLGKED